MSPKRAALVRALLVAFAATCCTAGPSWAQRNGDVRGGFDNQPTSREVQSREKTDGVLPPPAVERNEARAVDSIYQDLMGKNGANGTAPVPGGTAPPPGAGGGAPVPR